MEGLSASIPPFIMIYLYSGTPGSGKSLHAAQDIYNRLRFQKLPTIANFPINFQSKHFQYVPNHLLNAQFLQEFSRKFWGKHKVKEDSILLVLDEAQLLFNSRTFSQKDRMDWISFFSQHRHFGYKVILISQVDRMLDRQIRGLIEIETNHRRLGSFGIQGKLLNLLFANRAFCAVNYYHGLREKVGVTFFVYKKKYAKLYDTFATFDQVSEEENPSSNASVQLVQVLNDSFSQKKESSFSYNGKGVRFTHFINFSSIDWRKPFKVFLGNREES